MISLVWELPLFSSVAFSAVVSSSWLFRSLTSANEVEEGIIADQKDWVRERETEKRERPGTKSFIVTGCEGSKLDVVKLFGIISLVTLGMVLFCHFWSLTTSIPIQFFQCTAKYFLLLCTERVWTDMRVSKWWLSSPSLYLRTPSWPAQLLHCEELK